MQLNELNGSVKSLQFLIKNYFKIEDGHEQADDTTGLHDSYPNYIHYMLNHLGQPTPLWWEDEFHWITEQVGAVMVFDLREEFKK